MPDALSATIALLRWMHSRLPAVHLDPQAEAAPGCRLLRLGRVSIDIPPPGVAETAHHSAASLPQASPGRRPLR